MQQPRFDHRPLDSFYEAGPLYPSPTLEHLTLERYDSELRKKGGTSSVHVRVVDGLNPDMQYPDASLELVDLQNHVIHPTTILAFKNVPYGVYTLKASRSDRFGIKRVFVQRPQEWVLINVLLPVPEYTFWAETLKGRVLPAAESTGLWLKLVGIYSDFVQETVVGKSGDFYFVAPPGKYLLITLRSGKLCSQEVTVSETALNVSDVTIDLKDRCSN